MILPGFGKYQRRLWKQKPKQWGPWRAVHHRAVDYLEKLGINPGGGLYFPFWERAHQTIYDYLGFNAATFAGNISWQSPAFLRSDGSSGSTVDVGAFSRTAGPISVVTKIRINTHVYVCRYIQRANADGCGFSVRETNSSVLMFQDKVVDASFNRNTTNLGAGVWQHFVGTSDGVSTAGIHAYQNGNLDDAGTYSDNAGDGGGNDLEIFKRANQDAYRANGDIDYVLILLTELTAEQIAHLYDNEYGLIQPFSYPVYFEVAAGGTDIDATAGTVTITGHNPTVSAGTSISSDAGAIVVSGLNPSMSVGTDIAATHGTIAVAGLNPEISTGTDISATLGQVAIAGLNPSVSEGISFTATSGAVTVTGHNATIDLGVTIEAGLGTIQVTGYNPAVSAAVLIEATKKDVAVAGYNPSVSVGTDISAGPGAVVVSGHAASVSPTVNIDAITGAVTVTGFDADISAAIEILPGVGAIVIAGFNPSISVQLSETPAERIYSIPHENRVYSIPAESRIYSVEQENRIYSIPSP